MRGYAAKADANQTDIVSALRAVGASVQHLHSVGKGCPDLMVGYQGKTFAIEVKDGGKVPSARKLTAAQVEWHDAWKGHVAVAENVTEALRIIGALRGVIS